ncbi:hypothetical protein D3C80_1309470 [compost metagenome]
MLVLPELGNKGWKGFVKICLLSIFLFFFVHKTALILILIYPLTLFRLSSRQMILLLSVSMVWAFGGIGNVLVNVVGLNFIKNTPFLAALDFYSQNETFSAEIKFLSLPVLHRLLIVSIGIYFLNKLKEFKNFPVVFNLYFWGVIIYFILVPLGNILATRISMNLKIFDSLVIPYLFIVLKEKEFKSFAVLIVALWSLSILLYNFYLPGNYPYYIPYKTIFEK